MPSATIFYAIEALLLGASPNLTLTFGTGIVTGTTWVAGVPQVETATIVAAAGCTTNGTMTLAVTSTGMTGSPLNIPVALTTALNTASLVAAAARAALAANATIAARFTVGGTGATIVLTRRSIATHTLSTGDVAQYGATDGSLNIAIPVGLGISLAADSANTTAGTATSGAKIIGSGVDFQGAALPSGMICYGMAAKCEIGKFIMSGPTDQQLAAGGIHQHANPSYAYGYTALVVTSTEATTRLQIAVSAVS
jgi:hypothetical protein